MDNRSDVCDRVEFEREWGKMLTGERYNAVHPEFLRRLEHTRTKIDEFNSLRPNDYAGQRRILTGLLGRVGERFHINPPFRCDYGCNIEIGEDFFANFNLTILDEAKVRIGRNVFIGPGVSIYTACHPIEASERDSGAEWAEPVTIGDSVWIGGGAILLPGVTVGDRAVIGAGAVVTKDVPADTVVAGNPARIIRRIREMADDSDRIHKPSV